MRIVTFCPNEQSAGDDGDDVDDAGHRNLRRSHTHVFLLKHAFASIKINLHALYVAMRFLSVICCFSVYVGRLLCSLFALFARPFSTINPLISILSNL